VAATGWAGVGTAVVALALGVEQMRQFARRRRPYALWWSLSFLAAAAAAALQAVAFARGAWPLGAYRAYVVLAAAVPGVMGAGSVFLLYPRWAWAFAGVIVAAIALTLWGALGALHPAQLDQVMRATEQVTAVMPSPQVTWGFAILGTLGAAALVLGALWSYVRTRMAYNLGIAAGGVVFSLADTLASQGLPQWFFAAQVVGIVLMYLAVRAAALRRVPTTVPAGQGEGAPSPGKA
jgi:hypothetical protein